MKETSMTGHLTNEATAVGPTAQRRIHLAPELL